MPPDALEQLAERAQAFARCYTALSEALIREGVPEDLARVEARNAAIMAMLWREPDDTGEPWED